MDLVILTALVELIYSYSLIIDGHINAVWDTLRNGVIREEQGQRDIRAVFQNANLSGKIAMRARLEHAGH